MFFAHLLFLDVLGPTAFAPVKLDISGNIKVLYCLSEKKVFFINFQSICYLQL